MSEIIGSSELILNSDGSVFHLRLKPQEVAENIILVGDPGRVKMIAGFLDEIELQVQNREFFTITGQLEGKRISVISTGIGPDNIDIVINEIDAVFNINLEERKEKKDKKSLNFVRIGTSGALQKDIPVYSFVASRKSIGFDNLMNFYSLPENFSDSEFMNAFLEHTKWNPKLSSPYLVNCDTGLYTKIVNSSFIEGVNISSPGFYGPQGRKLRLNISDPLLNSKIESFSFQNMRITNFEMESSAIYGLSKLLGHHALTVCLIIANRMDDKIETGYQEKMTELIRMVLHSFLK